MDWRAVESDSGVRAKLIILTIMVILDLAFGRLQREAASPDPADAVAVERLVHRNHA